MNINRNNYEEFFLLYVDNELSAAEKKSVESFVHQNPDLSEEFMLLNQSKLIPDEKLYFEKKQSLLKTTVESLINKTNCEEYFLLYADGELNEEDRKGVELFAAQNPLYQKELDLLQKARLNPDEIILYKDKEKLYKKKRERRPFIYRMPGIAAAASIILLLGLYFLFPKQNINSKPIVPATSQADKNNEKLQPAVTSGKGHALHDTNAITKEMERKQIEPLVSSGNEKYRKSDLVEQPSDKNGVPSTQNNQKMNAARVNVDGDLIKKNDNVTVISSSPSISLTPIVASPVQPATNHQASLNPTKSDSALSQVAMIDKTALSEDVSIMSFSPKKNRMRGVFRRVTRVFEKTTNADDEKRSLLIGSFQIALK